ncbi:VOC family protein [Caulobacter hibisci]|uniref:VOC family protein n=1 Tax=Caulobacter hibisci TaxID=2035993 RepID=A0ABS0T0B2_9CAUL|nr:VOC family protein [Caulobacter hibisci]MBI1685332.1 VOC family protein [Caulobacter hibisci]
MAKVLGIGGVFFKAKDPKALAEWYTRVLGFETESWGGAVFQHPKIGMASWSPFPADTRYFEPSAASFMINLIVDDLDGVLAKAAAEGVEATGRQDEEYGRFAWLVDPEGFKVELWQPA